MNERQRRGLGHTVDWALEKIAERFDQQPFPTNDVAYGEGTLLGAPVDSFDNYLLHQINFFPDSGVVRVTAPDMRIELFRAAAPQPSDDGVLIENEAGTARIVFMRDSHITVEVSPVQSPLPHRGEHAPAADGSDSSTPIDSGVSGDATALREAPETARTGEQEEQGEQRPRGDA